VEPSGWVIVIDIMRRSSTFIHLLVGLALLLQGMAASAASLPQAQRDQAAMEMSAMDDMHCPMDAAGSGTDTQKSCCDHSCPDMASCFTGVGVAVSMSLLLVPAMTVEISAHPQGLMPRGTIVSLLRPPISFHG
jgi:hypothetical protein